MAVIAIISTYANGTLTTTERLAGTSSCVLELRPVNVAAVILVNFFKPWATCDVSTRHLTQGLPAASLPLPTISSYLRAIILLPVTGQFRGHPPLWAQHRLDGVIAVMLKELGEQRHTVNPFLER